MYRSFNNINESTKTVKADCIHCGTIDHIPYEDEAMVASWVQRLVPTQQAFPKVEPARREILISGTCKNCWNNMFGHVD